MKYSFHPEALEEYLNAVSYYLDISSPLAESFVEAFESGMDSVLSSPETWPIIEKDVRRYIVGKFPFGIYYRVEANLVMIYAVMHASRHPDSWKKRYH